MNLYHLLLYVLANDSAKFEVDSLNGVPVETQKEAETVCLKFTKRFLLTYIFFLFLVTVSLKYKFSVSGSPCQGHRAKWARRLGSRSPTRNGNVGPIFDRPL